MMMKRAKANAAGATRGHHGSDILPGSEDLLIDHLARLHEAEDGSDEETPDRKLATSRRRIKELLAAVEAEKARAHTLVAEVTDWNMVFSRNKLLIHEFAPFHAVVDRVCAQWRALTGTLTLSAEQHRRLAH